jgi:hypothetical protein
MVHSQTLTLLGHKFPFRFVRSTANMYARHVLEGRGSYLGGSTIVSTGNPKVGIVSPQFQRPDRPK